LYTPNSQYFCLCSQLNLKTKKPIFSSGSAKKTP
jgi:hypothetical protein